MGILDSMFSQYNGMLNIPQKDNGDWLASIMRGNYPGYSGPGGYSEPNGDQSGSTPMSGPYSREMMPQNTVTVDAGGYSPKPQESPGPLAGLFPLSSMFGQAQAAPQPPQAPASPFDAQRAPLPYANIGGMPQPSAPQTPTPPQQTAQGPSGHLNDGPVRYPVFGQPDAQQAAQAPTDVSSQSRMPQEQQQSLQPQQNTGPGFIEKLVGAMNPALGAQNTASRNQAQMARALHGALMQRGMSSQQAFAVAQAAATDPKMAEVLLPQALGLKPADTIEGAIARDMQNPGGPKMKPGAGLEALTQLEAAKAKGSKAGAVQGETQATAELALPSAVAQAKEQLRLIGDLRSHPGRDQVGWHDVLGSAPLVPSTKGYDASKILEQIKGGAFLEAFKSLKSGGAISEIEGTKATTAIARMDRAQSKAEFDRALSDYEGVIKIGIDRANQQAGREAPGGFKGNGDWTQVKPNVRIRQIQ